jgi:hypothetical protein
VKILSPLIIFLLIGCGYKPTTYYTTPVLGDKIATEVEIDIKNPTDSIYLSDALNESIVNIFNSKIDNNSLSKIKLKVLSISFEILDYDKNGYPILYRAKTDVKGYVTDKRGVINIYRGTGSYDFSITANSILDDETKHSAIKEAFIQSLQIIEFKIANKGMENDNKSN